MGTVSRLQVVPRGVVIVVAAMLAASCGGSEGPETRGEPLTIYVNAPFSGTAFVGETMVQGADLGARHVNDTGLNVGGRPYELRIVRADNRLSPQAAVANVRRAVADDAVAVVDEGTGVNASWRIAAQADVPLGITFQGGIGLVDPEARPNVFRIAPNDHGLAFRLAEYLIPKGVKLALLVDDSGYGQEGKKALEQAFRGQESVVARIGLPASATDVAPQVLRARRAGATGLLVWAQAPAISATITAARSAGWAGSSSTARSANVPSMKRKRARVNSRPFRGASTA